MFTIIPHHPNYHSRFFGTIDLHESVKSRLKKEETLETLAHNRALKILKSIQRQSQIKTLFTKRAVLITAAVALYSIAQVTLIALAILCPLPPMIAVALSMLLLGSVGGAFAFMPKTQNLSEAFKKESELAQQYIELLEAKTKDPDSYYQSIADWVEKNKISLDTLNMPQQEILTLAPKLTYLLLSEDKFSEEFIGEILDRTQQLKTVHIQNSSMTGSALARLTNAEHLETFEMKSCPRFNHDLPENMPNLQELRITDCEAFNPFAHKMDTALYMHRLMRGSFMERWRNLSEEEKLNAMIHLMHSNRDPEFTENNSRHLLSLFTDCRNDLLKMHPEYYYPLILQDTENASSEQRQKQKVAAIMRREDRLDVLKVAIRSFPHVALRLIQYLREEGGEDFEQLNLDLSSLSQEERLLFLLLHTPDQMQEMMSKISEERKLQWLKKPMNFNGATAPALHWFTGMRAQIMDPHTLKDFLNHVPLKTLAAFASFQANQEAVWNCAFAMNNGQLSVVIPQLGKSLLQFFKEISPLSHIKFLAFATTGQKRTYLNSDLLQFPKLQNWETVRPTLEEAVAACNENPKQDEYKLIKARWKEVSRSTNTAIQQYDEMLKQLLEVLSKYSPSEIFTREVKEALSEKMGVVEKIKKELKEMGEKVAALAQKFPVEDPVEEYDYMGEKLEEPYYHDHREVRLDLKTWAVIIDGKLISNSGRLVGRKRECPFCREEVTWDTLTYDKKLKERIDAQNENLSS